LDAVRKEVRSVEALLDEEERQATQEGAQDKKHEDKNLPPFGAAPWREECRVRKAQEDLLLLYDVHARALCFSS
jgi:hypothetical protein